MPIGPVSGVRRTPGLTLTKIVALAPLPPAAWSLWAPLVAAGTTTVADAGGPGWRNFDDYREKVRLAVERKMALGARTRLEIDIMNTKYADTYKIVGEDEQALAFLKDWIEYAQGLERKYALTPRVHDWDVIRSRHFLDQDENGSRYTLLDGVDLIWKRCHSWGNVVGEHHVVEVKDTYCPAPYDQFVIQWNGDVTTCCTDYEGRTKRTTKFEQATNLLKLMEETFSSLQDTLTAFESTKALLPHMTNDKMKVGMVLDDGLPSAFMFDLN